MANAHAVTPHCRPCKALSSFDRGTGRTALANQSESTSDLRLTAKKVESNPSAKCVSRFPTTAQSEIVYLYTSSAFNNLLTRKSNDHGKSTCKGHTRHCHSRRTAQGSFQTPLVYQTFTDGLRSKAIPPFIQSSQAVANQTKTTFPRKHWTTIRWRSRVSSIDSFKTRASQLLS